MTRIQDSATDTTLKSISCVICAYNEAARIVSILEAVRVHPMMAEIIVVDDGSTDETAVLARSVPGVRLISYPGNRGKTYALSQGIAAATAEYLMLIDADLDGLKAADIQALAEPVVAGKTSVSISLRANSLSLYRALGLDFVSGERLLPTSLVKPCVGEMEALPRWGAEAFMNQLITRASLPVTVVYWPSVFNIRKARKVGKWRGFLAELSMTIDVFRVLSPAMVVSQNLALLRLSKRRTIGRGAGSSSFGNPLSSFGQSFLGRKPAA